MWLAIPWRSSHNSSRATNRWAGRTSAGTLWTIVNRNEYEVSGSQLGVPHKVGLYYYDRWHGVELKPAVAGDKATLTFDIEGLGYGAVLATENHPAWLPKLLASMGER